ncbi:cysteine desulfurase-like protein [Streptomyces sp. ODS28]|uniref:cysteine desulfurase-like protein n=1 Tax=Streptomyces sp. ODS28 TaxID=3136688 RepID=UPI0031EC94B1
MTYDIAALRDRIPALGAGCAHFDGPGGTQTPRPVIEAMAAALAEPLSNRGRQTRGERNAEAQVLDARRALADLLGAGPREIVLGRSATQLAYDVSRTLAQDWGPDDEVVVTRLDHDSNIRPWVQAAERVGATVRWAGFDVETGELRAEHIREVLSERTRLVAVTAASNLIGTCPPILPISAEVHETGALLYVDGVHYTAHRHVDIAELGADFFTCSPYKFFGPHLGVLAARPGLLEELHPEKLLPSSDEVPERFEYGTLPYELLAGARAAVDLLAELGGRPESARRDRLSAAFAAIGDHEDGLRLRIEKELAGMDRITVHSRAADRTPTLLLTFEGASTEAAYRYLAARDVDAPSGSFYALEASRHMGLGDDGGLRAGLSPYTTADDADRLLEGLAGFLARN